MPEAYRTSLKWFAASPPANNLGIEGDYCLLWGTFANYGTRTSIYGPKMAAGWPENGEGGFVPIAPPGTDVLQIGLLGEGPTIPESTSTQLIAVGLDSEVILAIPVNTGGPVQNIGLQSGPAQLDVVISSGFDALNTRGV